MTTAMYAVEGMMCDSCMAAVQEKVQSLSGVTVVARKGARGISQRTAQSGGVGRGS